MMVRPLRSFLFACTLGLLTGSPVQAAGRCNLSAPDARAAGPGCARAWMDRNLKLNDILAVGTHNSYKTSIPPDVMDALRVASPDDVEGLDYGHRPLIEQLDAGARQIEIDVYYDPAGGRFAHPALLAHAQHAIEPWRAEALARPGFKVMHVPDVDVLASCPTLTMCLELLKGWSRRHPDHTPIMLMFNAKEDQASMPGGTGALPFTEAAFGALDAEIRSVLGPEDLITPDDVQGSYPTLRDAVLHDNWPTLGRSRGKFLFALDEDGEKVVRYRGARKSLEGRVFFVNIDEDSPAAAYLTLNDVPEQSERIARDVKAGFLVRTRADASTVEARRDDVRRRDAAFASGAQYVSTDYLWPDPRFRGGYEVRLPGGAAALCNPVRAAGKCAGLPIETVGKR